MIRNKIKHCHFAKTRIRDPLSLVLGAMKRILAISLILLTSSALAEIPVWYIEGKEAMINASESVVLYEVESSHFEEAFGPYFISIEQGKTIKVLKGSAPPNTCYSFQVEGKPKHWLSGTRRLAIFSAIQDDGCAFVDVGRSSPGSIEYVELFQTIIQSVPKNGAP